MADDFAPLDRWLQDLASRLSPGERKRLSMAMLRELRRANADRIARNVQPDGSGMEPRKPRKERRNKRMFRRLRLARNMRIKADADGGELGFASALIEKTAAAHHFGLEDYVGKTRTGRVIRTRYPRREIIGFGRDDVERIQDAAIDHLAK